MSIYGIQQAGQRLAESLMKDTCTIRRRSGETWDPDLGRNVPEWEDVYSGKCQIKSPSGQQGEAEAGGREVVHAYPILKLPLGESADVQVDDVATITFSTDPALVGRRLRIRDLDYGSLTTARRLPVEDDVA